MNVPNHCGAFFHSPFMQRVRSSLLRKNRNYSPIYIIPTIFQRFPRDTIGVSMLKKKSEILGGAFSNGATFLN